MLSSLTTFIYTHPIIILFLIANLVIGFWAHRKSKPNNFEDYALASRSLPAGVLVMTLLGTLLDTGIFHQSSNAFRYGAFLQLGGIIACAIAFCLIGTLIAPLLVHFEGSLTIGDLMEQMYGRTARIVTGIVSCMVCLLMITPQLQAISGVINCFLKVPAAYTIIGLGLLVILYSASGGMRSVSYTDVLQVMAILLTASWVVHTVFQKLGGIQAVVAQLPDEKMKFISHPKLMYKLKSAAFWRFIPVFMLTPPVMQRMLVVQNKRQVRDMWYVSAFLYSLIATMLICIGLGAIVGDAEFKLHGDSHELLPRLMKNLFENQTWTLQLLSLGLIAVALSTMDSYLHAIGITVVQDILAPLSNLFSTKSGARKKTLYARIGIICIGLFATFMAFVQGSVFFNREAFQFCVIIYALIIIPLIIGVLGIKTDKASWLSFCLVYAVSVVSFKWLQWHNYDIFLVALPLAILAYFATHIYLNGGIVTLKRSQQTISEQLWVPSWQGTAAYIKSWFLAPLQLPVIASRKVIIHPTHSLSFSMVIFALYTLSSVMTGGASDTGLANFMAGVHAIGITLCVGLMLEGIWPNRFKSYFPLYWFFTLFYCLSFGSTLAFLRAHEGVVNAALWLGSFMLLAMLVDSTTFLSLGLLGSGIAFGGYYMLNGALPADLWHHDTSVMAALMLALLTVGVLLFARSREQHASARLDWNRTASSILGHDLRLTVQMLSGVGHAINQAFQTSETIQNPQGKEGYWIDGAKAKFLEEFGTKLIEKSNEAKDDIKRFLDFMKQQVMGWLEQKKMSMHKTAQDVIHKMEDKYANSMKMNISCKKDFEANVFSVFPNVISNLLKNAANHGQATKFDIVIDGEKRTLTIRDNGKGIPSDLLPRIFDLNFTTGDKHDENSGVGLAFVKMIIEASSGQISCHSRRGDKHSFTEFIITFPEV